MAHGPLTCHLMCSKDQHPPANWTEVPLFPPRGFDRAFGQAPGLEPALLPTYDFRHNLRLSLKRCLLAHPPSGADGI